MVIQKAELLFLKERFIKQCFTRWAVFMLLFCIQGFSSGLLHTKGVVGKNLK